MNQIYDILYMMDRDDVAVGVGGEGGILEDGTIQPNVGGYLSIIEQVRIHFFHWNKVLPLFPNTYDCEAHWYELYYHVLMTVKYRFFFINFFFMNNESGDSASLITYTK